MTFRPFADLAPTPVEHFGLHFYAAVARLLDQVATAFEGQDTAFQHFPFLKGYHAELDRRGLAGRPVEWWRTALADWEREVPGHLPLRALRVETGLDETSLTLLFGLGLIEEDARFGLVFESMHGHPGQRRPTVGLLDSWWRGEAGPIDVRTRLRFLRDLGLVQVVNPEAARMEWALQPSSLVWDAIRGESHENLAPWLTHHPSERLTPFETLTVPETLKARLRVIAGLLESRRAGALIVRGPRHNGRRTVLGAVARSLGRGLLEVNATGKPDDDRTRVVGPLATLLNAVPAFVLDLAPGESAISSRPVGYEGPIGFILGQQGGLTGQAAETALTITLEVPDRESRVEHWRSGFGTDPPPDLDAIAERFRMTGGNIRRAARLARSHAALAGRELVEIADVREANRSLNRQALDTLATRVVTIGDWSHLAASPETLRELHALERRCRHRESLGNVVGQTLAVQLHPGVRALFSGVSGTGKTLAARLVASSLEIDLYRVDLSSVVNKYIGETEKNLNQLFSLAEELDVILLLDEGDALLTQRTNVQTSNDRYANLETNYLLQRLESFEGILIVTTNAGDRIDGAFRRRMDVVVEFSPPEPPERWSIWQMHLPKKNEVDPEVLAEIAGRCVLTGGQIRNCVLHASLLAFDDTGVLKTAHLEMAVRREYVKAGEVYPIRNRTNGVARRI